MKTQTSRFSRWMVFLAVGGILLLAPALSRAGVNTWTGGSPAGASGTEAKLIAADPSNPRILYAVFDPDVYRSGDGGRSWTRIGSFGSDTSFGTVFSFLVSPTSPSTLFAAAQLATASGLFRTTDGGLTWSNVAANKIFTALAARASEPSTVYAGTSNGLVTRSEDGGDTWGPSISLGLPAQISALLFDPSNKSGLYAAGGDDTDYPSGYPPTLILGRSTDRGDTWSNLGTSLPHLAAVEAIALSPSDPSTLFVGLANRASPNAIQSGVLRSSDGGTSWLPAVGGLPAATNVFGLVADPQHSGTLYAATDSGLYRTKDDGGSWSPFGRQLAGYDVEALVLAGGSLHAGTPFGVFDLDPSEGAVDVSAGPGVSRVLSWNADRLSVSTLGGAGDPVSTPAEGPFTGWTATAISDGLDGLSRVLWVHGDGRAGLEIVGPSGAEAAFRFAAIPQWTATDVAATRDGGASVLWTSAPGAMFVATVDSTGAATVGPIYGRYGGWSPLSIAEGGDGSTWVLWRSTDGRSGVSRFHARTLNAAYRFDASPGWAAEDIAVGADGRPRILWKDSGSGLQIWTVDGDGRLTAGQTYENPGLEARRIAASSDGLTRVLWTAPDETSAVWLFNADNTLASSP